MRNCAAFRRRMNVLTASARVDQCAFGADLVSDDFLDLQHIGRSFAARLRSLVDGVADATRNAAGEWRWNDALLDMDDGRCHVDAAEPVEDVLLLCERARGIAFDSALEPGDLRLAFLGGAAGGVQGVGGVCAAPMQARSPAPSMSEEGRRTAE
jgi:hypothetical protein